MTLIQTIYIYIYILHGGVCDPGFMHSSELKVFKKDWLILIGIFWKPFTLSDKCAKHETQHHKHHLVICTYVCMYVCIIAALSLTLSTI